MEQEILEEYKENRIWGFEVDDAVKGDTTPPTA